MRQSHTQKTCYDRTQLLFSVVSPFSFCFMVFSMVSKISFTDCGGTDRGQLRIIIQVTTSSKKKTTQSKSYHWKFISVIHSQTATNNSMQSRKWNMLCCGYNSQLYLHLSDWYIRHQQANIVIRYLGWPKVAISLNLSMLQTKPNTPLVKLSLSDRTVNSTTDAQQPSFSPHWKGHWGYWKGHQGYSHPPPRSHLPHMENHWK